MVSIQILCFQVNFSAADTSVTQVKHESQAIMPI